MTTKHMQFGVSQNLLVKIPRYFGGKRSILRELFQNSFRANAKNVIIHYNERTLLFEDDGRGSDAQSLLTAGQSGVSMPAPNSSWDILVLSWVIAFVLIGFLFLFCFSILAMTASDLALSLLEISAGRGTTDGGVSVMKISDLVDETA